MILQHSRGQSERRDPWLLEAKVKKSEKGNPVQSVCSSGMLWFHLFAAILTFNPLALDLQIPIKDSSTLGEVINSWLCPASSLFRSRCLRASFVGLVTCQNILRRPHDIKIFVSLQRGPDNDISISSSKSKIGQTYYDLVVGQKKGHGTTRQKHEIVGPPADVPRNK